MLFRQLFDVVSSTYTYLLADPRSKEAIIIDPVFEHHLRDRALVNELGLNLRYSLDTHAHADHVTGAWLFKQALGSQIVLSRRYDAQGVDLAVDHGDVITFGDYAIEIRATPGHTAGCLTFVSQNQNFAFTGDCLLIRAAGRTDFQQGDAAQMFRSIHEQIFSLPESCFIYPAHDYAGRMTTTVGEEKSFNPRIGGQANETDFVGYMNNLNLPHPKKIDLAVPANMQCGRPEELIEQPVPLWGPVTMTYAGIPQIDAEWVYTHLDQLFVLDVREADELVGPLGRIAGAVHIPLAQLPQHLPQVEPNRPIVAVCRSGRRSARATEVLRTAGLTQTANLAGGMLQWHQLSLPTDGANPLWI